MNLKEHLQFFAMMIPTLLLLAAAAVTVAFPTGSLGEPVPAVQSQHGGGEMIALNVDIGPLDTAPER